MLPHSFLILPPRNSSVFAKFHRKLTVQSLRFLLTSSLVHLPHQMQYELIHIRNVLTQLLKVNPQKLYQSIELLDVQTALLNLQTQNTHTIKLWNQAIICIFKNLQTIHEPILWTTAIHQIIDAKQRQLYDFDAPLLAMSCDPTGISIQKSNHHIESLSEQEFSNPFYSIHPELTECSLSLMDSNPFYTVEAHPDKSGNIIDLGGYDLEEWQRMLRESFEIIKVFVPEIWHELPLFFQRIIPVGFHPQQHFSATYAQAPGLAYLSLHPDLLTMTEAIIHESQHSKINMIFLQQPLLHNAFDEWSASPVRPDLRPLHGVLLAAHAFVPVSAMHKRLADMNHPISHSPIFKDRQKQVWQSNDEALKTLNQKAIPTQIGEKLLDGLNALHQALAL